MGYKREPKGKKEIVYKYAPLFKFFSHKNDSIYVSKNLLLIYCNPVKDNKKKKIKRLEG